MKIVFTVRFACIKTFLNQKLYVLNFKYKPYTGSDFLTYNLFSLIIAYNIVQYFKNFPCIIGSNKL